VRSAPTTFPGIRTATASSRNVGYYRGVADDDLEMLERWRAGDGAAGNALFHRHFETVYRFFARKTEGDIDDLVQETFLACLHSVEGFRRRSSFRTYLLAIARHTLFGYWRRRAITGKMLDFDEISVASLSTTAGTQLAKQQDRAALLNSLRELPLDQQILLEMYYWQGLDREQLAEVYEVAEATIGTRLFRARRALQDRLDAVSADARRPADDFDAWAASLRGEVAADS
jgi:RNA polymerase sigma factor (sigma-70 family)